MSRRRSARLNTRVEEDAPAVTLDERLKFLKQTGDKPDILPLRTQFEHRIEGATGPVEVVYWPSKVQSASAPEQVTLFILGEPS